VAAGRAREAVQAAPAPQLAPDHDGQPDVSADTHADLAEPAAWPDHLPAAVRPGSAASVTGEPTFDPLRNKRYLGQLLRRSVIYAVAGVTVELLILFIGGFFALVGGFTALAVLPVVTFLVGLAGFLCFWLLPVPAMLAYDSRIVTFEARSADRTLACVAEALDRHRTPRDSLRERDLSLPGEGRRHYLEIRRGVFAGYVCCFGSGHDLYLSWTFWIYMSPLRCVILRVSRMMQNLGGRGNDLYQTLRFESARAMVGALQLCTAEAIETAITEQRGGDPYSLPEGPEVPIG
jgi:hypothetical protein